MIIGKRKYRFTSLILLFSLLSHISVFHAPMQEKILCTHDDGSVHFENISESEFAANFLFSLERTAPVYHQNCTDYRLDFHIDKISGKQIQKLPISQRVISVLDLKKIYNQFLQFSFIKQQLPQISLQNYSTVSLLI